jgi:hypothetical protein
MAKAEIAGVPTVLMGFEDQLNFARNTNLLNGAPNARWVTVPRVGTGEERVATFYNEIEEALTSPLTADEQQSGLYQPPAQPRVAFEGTLNDAQEFFAQTTLVENCRNCPIATWTDGLPIIVPTEEAVTEMLTGTSHDPQEKLISYSLNAETGDIEAGNELLYARSYTATVEKAAICAVMAGCKPEYMPVVLAIAASGGASTNCPGTSGPYGYLFVVSGPISKEIGMNAGQEALDVGNIANMTLGRVGALITISFGGCITGAVRSDSGNPIHSVCFPEDLEGLPPGWVGYNQEEGYDADMSVIGKIATPGMWSIVQAAHSPGSLRQLLSGNGQGGASRYLQQLNGIPEGTPGYYNWLQLYTDAIIQVARSPGGHTYIMHPGMAQGLYDYGFGSKEEAYQWLAETYFITEDEYYHSGWWDFFTDGGKAIERTSGLPYNELPPDYQLAAFGSAMSNCFIVGAGFADELCYILGTGRPRSSYPVDPWK